jgi:predicted nucleic acid-binding protein
MPILPDRSERLVLDTDIASRLLRDRLTGPLVPRVVGRPWCVTFVTVGELWLWAFSRRWGSRSRRELEDWLRGVTILPYSREVAHTWGQITAAARLRGRPRPDNDTWIAACCLADGLPLATGNVKDHVDFAEHEGLHLIHK